MLRYLVVLSRPRFWPYLAGPVVVGAAFGATTTGALASIELAVLFVFFLVPANVYLYGINDRFDRETDQRNPKKARREASYRKHRGVDVIVVASGGLLLGVPAVVEPIAWPYLALWAILATAYSVPPLRLKARPVLDSFVNGLYILPGGAAYATLAGYHPPALALMGGWAWAMGMHTFSAIPDIEPDRAAGVSTTATRLGASRALRYCGVVWSVAAVGFGLLDWRLALPLSVYPATVVWIGRSSITVDRAYWWFPAVNTVVGGMLTLGGLWRLVYA